MANMSETEKAMKIESLEAKAENVRSEIQNR